MKVKLYSNKKIYFNGFLAFLFKRYLNINTYHKSANNFSKCSFCKSERKEEYVTKAIPDFDINTLSYNIAKRFYTRSIGKCLNCGLIQEYNKFSKKELRRYFNEISSKDNTINEDAWQSYPVPKSYKKFLFKRHFKKRFNLWKKKLNFKKKPKRILLLRPTLGFLAEFFLDNYKNCSIDFLDISEVSIKTIKSKFKNKVNLLNGNIHYTFSGNFLKKKKYDLIVTNHLLIHCSDVNYTMKCLKKLTKPNGNIILTDEINVKYHNPFHINFWDEKMLIKILKKNFSKVNLIRNCGYKTYSTTPFTKHGDNPDFFINN